jgi:hypothetical protein
MKADGITLILDIVQTIVISLSFIVLIWQLGQFNKNLRHSAMTRDFDYYVKVNEWLLNRPKIATMLYSKGSDFARLNRDKKDMYNFLALIFGFFEHMYFLRKEKIISRDQWEAWDSWLNSQIYSNSCFEVFWHNEKYAFRPPFRKYIDGCYETYVINLQNVKNDNIPNQRKPRSKRVQ